MYFIILQVASDASLYDPSHFQFLGVTREKRVNDGKPHVACTDMQFPPQLDPDPNQAWEAVRARAITNASGLFSVIRPLL